MQDVRDLIAHHFGHEQDEAPALAVGWRAEVVGQVIDRLLDGELSIRITDPNSNQPLSFEPTDRPAIPTIFKQPRARFRSRVWHNLSQAVA